MTPFLSMPLEATLAQLASLRVQLLTGCSPVEAACWLEECRQELMRVGERCDPAACADLVCDLHELANPPRRVA